MPPDAREAFEQVKDAKEELEDLREEYRSVNRKYNEYLQKLKSENCIIHQIGIYIYVCIIQKHTYICTHIHIPLHM